MNSSVISAVDQIPEAPYDGNKPFQQSYESFASRRDSDSVQEDYSIEETSLVSNRGVNNSSRLKINNLKRGVALTSAAAIAGGVTGLVVAGPLVAVVGAVGAGALSTHNSFTGDVARASGSVLLVAGDRAKKLDEKHDILYKVKNRTGRIFNSSKRFNEKHQILNKVRRGVKGTIQFIMNKLQPTRTKMITRDGQDWR